MANWEMKRIEVRREYEVTDALDLQDTTSARRMVIRPRKVTLHQVYGTNLVRYAAIEGRQVRRDGDLSNSRDILAGVATRGFWCYCTPPGWLNDILADEGLEWASSE